MKWEAQSLYLKPLRNRISAEGSESKVSVPRATVLPRSVAQQANPELFCLVDDRALPPEAPPSKIHSQSAGKERPHNLKYEVQVPAVQWYRRERSWQCALFHKCRGPCCTSSFYTWTRGESGGTAWADALTKEQHSCVAWQTAGSIFGGLQSVQLCAELGLIFVLTWVRLQTPKPRESKSTTRSTSRRQTKKT